MAAAGVTLLAADGVGTYLAARGLVASPDVHVEELAGGVSNAAFAVDRLVVKQSLPRLRVADEWLAKRERILTEARALELAGRLSPDCVPEVIDVDPAAFTLTISRAPAVWANWKNVLLDGELDVRVGARLGSFLGLLHDRTWGDEDVGRAFSDYEAFEQLRLDPFHRTVAERIPAAAAAVERVLERLRTTRLCLVHGDYSPKNVLVGREGLWVLDFEVAHFGDPVFDVSFMLGHLLLTAVHAPGRADGIREIGEAFWDAYLERLAPARRPDPADVVVQVACLCLARTDGKSLEAFLTRPERERVRELALGLLDSGRELTEIWRLA